MKTGFTATFINLTWIFALAKIMTDFHLPKLCFQTQQTDGRMDDTTRAEGTRFLFNFVFFMFYLFLISFNNKFLSFHDKTLNLEAVSGPRCSWGACCPLTS